MKSWTPHQSIRLETIKNLHRETRNFSREIKEGELHWRFSLFGELMQNIPCVGGLSLEKSFISYFEVKLCEKFKPGEKFSFPEISNLIKSLRDEIHLQADSTHHMSVKCLIPVPKKKM